MPRLRVSVIVPCCGKHVGLLPELIDALHKQERWPDEIVVGSSGLVEPSLGGGRVIHSSEPQTAGQNRNRASDAATGDLLIYQDADDLPHPMRIAIIAEAFEAHQIDHLMHHYQHQGPWLDLAPVAVTMCRGELDLESGVTNGNVAIRRHAFDAVRWPEHPRIGEDQEFNRAVYAHFGRTAVIPQPLLMYRNHLSSFR